MPARTVKPRRPLTPVGVLERRLGAVLHAELREEMLHVELHRVVGQAEPLGDLRVGEPAGDQRPDLALARRDRKSTRLNSSHGYISYAVFCLKKKTKQQSLSTRSTT